MKKRLLAAPVVAMIVGATTSAVRADKPASLDGRGAGVDREASARHRCTRIQDGTLLNPDGSPIRVGFDEWGYNY